MHYEKIWLNEYEGEGGAPCFYRRYVDDIFAVFENQTQASNFLVYLNSKHPNIKFTKEENQNGVLNFLDVKVNNRNKIITSVYHKPTFTGLLTNFRSFVPTEYKTRLIKTLTDRAFKINNTWIGLDSDFKKLGHYLMRNLYPQRFIERNLKNS